MKTLHGSFTVALALAGALALGACSGMSQRDKSTAVGAGVGAVGGAVLTGGSAAGTVGGAAVGGVKAVGGAAVGGVKAVGGAIGGIFGGGDKAATNATEAAKPE